MSDCKHEQLQADTFIDKAGLPAQKIFNFLRCKACGEIFPISPERSEHTPIELKDILKSLISINNTLSGIRDKK